MDKDNSKSLLLVENGVFPIIYDQNNKKIKNKTELGSGYPGTIQGEGLFMGTPCLFIRLSGCNYRCIFSSHNETVTPNKCDTWYSSFEHEQNWVSIKDIEKTVRNNIKKGQHLVISGGEPYLQAKKLVILLDSLKDLELIVTIETNGSIFDEELTKRITLASLSPKLNNSTPTIEKCEKLGIKLADGLLINHEKFRNNLLPIKKFVDFANTTQGLGIQLKFVVTCESDIEEIQRKYISEIEGVESHMIYLMPEGITPEEMKSKAYWVINQCIKYNYNYCPRLHVELYGEKREV